MQEGGPRSRGEVGGGERERPLLFFFPPRSDALASFSLPSSPHLVVLVRAVREVEAGDGHASPQQLLQDGDLPGLGAQGADDLRMGVEKKGERARAKL